MCGIIAIAGIDQVAEKILRGLQNLEYRGYDSAGLAVLDQGEITCLKAKGKLSALEKLVAARPSGGTTGIGHTRWATHGKPSQANAHPHIVGGVGLVHNGIIENFAKLRKSLEDAGCVFKSQTDSEVIVQMIAAERRQGLKPLAAVRAVIKRLQGAFSLAIIFVDWPGHIIGVCRGSPLALGYGKGEHYLASDAIGLTGLCDQMTYLEEGSHVVMANENAIIYDDAHQVVQRRRTDLAMVGMVDKAGFKHFMHKEIHQQPTVVGETFGQYADFPQNTLRFDDLQDFLGQAISTGKPLSIIACGTSYYAAQIGRYWIESLVGIPVLIDYASEFRYRQPALVDGGVVIIISQSGETADSLAALRYAREHGQKVIAIVNVAHSSIAREADALLLTYAGVEISVASTKAFTSQLAVLACLSLHMAQVCRCLTDDVLATIMASLRAVPSQMIDVLGQEKMIVPIASTLAHSGGIFYLGRGVGYPMACEGALKLKEVSYLFTQAYAAGEMKHGPISLIEDGTCVIVLAPSGSGSAKIASNIAEVQARGARVIVLSDQTVEQVDQADSIGMPAVDDWTMPFVYALPCQLLAYHTALLRGTDIDQPRNLAKSVTVE